MADKLYDHDEDRDAAKCKTPLSEAGSTSQSFFQRLIEEKHALDHKMGRLYSFLHEEDRVKITTTQTELLELQLGHMKHYASCLNLRIADIQSNKY